ncbi:helix-turn-helix transcriptional regulator [Streptomyces sp. NBC_00385]|uniref:helix-turn-helix transcriptional regulator n=1 Tax=Streptomyces sp. NBC_00385 TaxID=2975733 RepID=UPI002DDB60A5|nr:helix-turn-helix transcriptional regulator [Streptomyces sp. NBC_00385]WRZ03675.1 helix-turn-helix transcriptional regulator [Streptomyces sp. NBC_00385]
MFIDAADWSVYECLLFTHPPTTEQVSRTTGQSLAEVRAAVDRLRELGLVETGPGSSDEILPVPPDSALLPALRRWESQLDRTRHASDGLIHRWRRRNRRHEDLIQTVGESDAGWAAFEQLQVNATEEVLIFDRPPYVAPPSGNPAQLDAMGRGVVYRTVYTQEALSDEVRQNLARAAIAGGERARISDRLPMKLVVVDRRLAMVPLQGSAGTLDSAVLIAPSALLDGLLELFEMTWDRALPLTFEEKHVTHGVPDWEEDLVRLLASGLTDPAIGRALGCSERTVQRRITQLMTRNSVANRFQLGAQLVYTRRI